MTVSNLWEIPSGPYSYIGQNGYWCSLTDVCFPLSPINLSDWRVREHESVVLESCKLEDGILKTWLKSCTLAGEGASTSEALLRPQFSPRSTTYEWFNFEYYLSFTFHCSSFDSKFSSGFIAVSVFTNMDARSNLRPFGFHPSQSPFLIAQHHISANESFQSLMNSLASHSVSKRWWHADLNPLIDFSAVLHRVSYILD